MSLPLFQKQSEQVVTRDLVRPETCQAYLREFGKAIDSPSLLVTASQFSKWYARALACSALELQTTNGRGLDVSLEKTVIHVDLEGGKWKQNIEMSCCKPVKSSWEDTVYHVFHDHLTPIWRTINKVTKIPMPILWENTAFVCSVSMRKSLQRTQMLYYRGS